MRKIMNRTMSLLLVAIMAFSLAPAAHLGITAAPRLPKAKRRGETAGAQTGQFR